MKHPILLSAMLMVAVTTTAVTAKEKGGQVFHAVVAQDGTGDYLTVQAAIDAAPVGRTEPWRIYIKEGTYKEHVDIPESKPYLSLIGEGRHKTQISCDRLCGGPTGVKVDEGATVTARSSNLFFEGINFVNSYGHEQKDGPQALALFTQGDRVVLSRCGLLSFQDTWLTPFRLPNLRNYAVNCFIEGAVDFIYGQGNVFFDSDTLFIMRKKGGYIVAPNHHPDTEWGYVFRDNVITAPGDAIETQVFLGRPWHAQPKVAFINTKAEVTVYPEGWRNHMGGLPTLFAEYGTTDWQGHRLDLSHRCSRYWVENEQKDTIWCTSKAVITADEAALYTVENVLSGTDGWQPRQVMTSCPQPVVGTVGKYLIWQPVADAVGYVVTVNGQTKRFTTDCRTPYNKKNTYRVQSVSRWGALSR
ncbi:MAG: pectin esterase [Prevotella sp.]|nr:pectin esterase [Prevotella sp.]